MSTAVSATKAFDQQGTLSNEARVNAAMGSFVSEFGVTASLQELNVLTRCDCTTRNEKKALMLSRRMDDLEALPHPALAFMLR